MGLSLDFELLKESDLMESALRTFEKLITPKTFWKTRAGGRVLEVVCLVIGAVSGRRRLLRGVLLSLSVLRHCLQLLRFLLCGPIARLDVGDHLLAGAAIENIWKCQRSLETRTNFWTCLSLPEPGSRR